MRKRKKMYSYKRIKGGGVGAYQLSAWPEVRGTADTDGGAYSPFRSILLVLTHDFIIIQLYGPATRDMKTKILFIKHILRDNNLIIERNIPTTV